MTNYFKEIQFDNSIDEIQIFFDILYHDRRKGNNCILYKSSAGETESDFNVFNAKGIEINPDVNTYASLSTFIRRRRKNEDVFNRSIFTIDLDCHDDNYSEIKKNTRAFLNKCFNNNLLPIPTMIVDSGRGYQIHYVKKASIGAKGPRCSRKANERFDIDYAKVITAYENQLKKANREVCHVDAGITDGARVARIPGTYNTKTGNKAKLLFINFKSNNKVNYYERFEDITRFDPFIGVEQLERNYKKRFSTDRDDIAIVEKIMLLSRYKRLCKIMEYRKNIPEHNRQNMCFLAYNFMIQIGDEFFAEEKMRELNNISNYPLSRKELKKIERQFHKSKYTYKFTDKKIIEFISLDEEEVKLFSDANKREIKRALIKCENDIDREIRNSRIAEVIQVYEEVPMNMIAVENGISLRLVNKIAKEYGVQRRSECTGDITEVLKSNVHFFVTVLCSDIKRICAGGYTVTATEIASFLEEGFGKKIESVMGARVPTVIADCLNNLPDEDITTDIVTTEVTPVSSTTTATDITSSAKITAMDAVTVIPTGIDVSREMTEDAVAKLGGTMPKNNSISIPAPYVKPVLLPVKDCRVIMEQAAAMYDFDSYLKESIADKVTRYNCIQSWAALLQAQLTGRLSMANSFAFNFIARQIGNMSESRLSRMLEVFGEEIDVMFTDGIFGNDADFYFEYCNRRFTSFMGKADLKDIHIKRRFPSRKQRLNGQRQGIRMGEADNKKALLYSNHADSMLETVCELYKQIAAIPYEDKESDRFWNSDKYETYDYAEFPLYGIESLSDKNAVKHMVWYVDTKDIVDYSTLVKQNSDLLNKADFCKYLLKCAEDNKARLYEEIY